MTPFISYEFCFRCLLVIFDILGLLALNKVEWKKAGTFGGKLRVLFSTLLMVGSIGGLASDEPAGLYFVNFLLASLSYWTYLKQRKSPDSSAGSDLVGFSCKIRWLLGKEGRDYLDLALADIERDRKQMIDEGMKPWPIRLCLSWRIGRTLVPIFWNALIVILRQIAVAAKLVREIAGKP